MMWDRYTSNKSSFGGIYICSGNFFFFGVVCEFSGFVVKLVGYVSWLLLFFHLHSFVSLLKMVSKKSFSRLASDHDSVLTCSVSLAFESLFLSILCTQ